MTERSWRILNFFVFGLILVVFLNLQTVFWFHFLGDYTAPSLWALMLIYATLKRNAQDHLILLFIVSVLVAAHSLWPWGWIFLSGLGVHVIVDALRRRINLGTAGYYAIMGASGVFLFNLLAYAASRFADANPMDRPAIIRWLVQSITSGGLAPLVFAGLEKVDRWTHQVTLEGGDEVSYE